MTKLLILVAAVVAIVWLLRRAFAGPRKGEAPAQEQGEPKGDLVTCAHCGVNLPKGEAYAARGDRPDAGSLHYCSEEHQRRGPRDG